MPKWIFPILLVAAAVCQASDHLDTRTVVKDPRADVGDFYAWMSADRTRLELAMTLVGHELSPALEYRFHVGSGTGFGRTTVQRSIVCRASSTAQARCRLEGVDGESVELRVFAGLRDDPFFNNVKGARDAYQVAAVAMKDGAAFDEARCPALGTDTSRRLLDTWRSTDGGPAQDFLRGWTPMSIVVSVPREAVDGGGPLLAVWAATATAQRQLDRMGRPLTGNALLAPLAHDDVSDALKEQYNAGAPAEWPRLIPAIQETLGLYDGFDGVCGNQWLADAAAKPSARYGRLAQLLADDRLWIDSRSGTCERFMAVELASLDYASTKRGDRTVKPASPDGAATSSGDCGGRTPTQDAVDVFRSLLAAGTTRGVDDGVDRDELEHDIAEFPFLAAPEREYRP